MSIRLGTEDIAKYPFLNEASEYVRETNFGIAEFDRPEMEYIINRATLRAGNRNIQRENRLRS